ncbi:MAG: type II CAAX endopeptidase family protein [Phycisphaerae bacterium]
MTKYLFDNSVIDITIFLLGLFLLGRWLLTTSFGRRSLDNSRERTNYMPPVTPWFFLLLWFCVYMLVAHAVSSYTQESSPQRIFLQTLLQIFTNIAVAIAILIYVRRYFSKGLNGFGFDHSKIGKDLLCAVGYFIAMLPLVFAAIRLILIFGRLIISKDFQIEPHEQLKLIVSYTQPSIRIAILVSGAIITPFFEEILFRGLVQNSIRNMLNKPWPAIFISSAIFTFLHPNVHWLAIYVVGLFLGYAYEKSGSLYRSIFLHAIFNGFTIIAVMTQSPPQ